ncbi:carbohydrate-binding domain-containing protein [Glutamicibacter sp. MNS18]|uniref:carbohydrate-binding domain-containing protein n=1 Tax=Glutamicibacter sp. MNS18 TaxID=2989817 RepID=UPI0022366D10|nr:carbohydrate-binding domain-containing protein [Glutamicibacter sp. MNS18]MCW4464982.1 carbohydrate-binding domain-containing protein [Glutamicibacter sp. MNS18]
MKLPVPTKIVTSMAALSLALTLAGCAAGGQGTVAEAGNTSAAEATPGAHAAASGSGTTSVDADQVTEDTHFDADDLQWDDTQETSIALSDGGSTVQGQDASGVSVDGGTVTLSAAGTYRLSGGLSDGRIVVSATKEEVVRIILDGVSISNSSGPAVQVDEANEVLLYLQDGTTNTLNDATSYADTADEAANAAVYSKADLTIAGEGSLAVQGNYRDGIVSKDGLVLVSGSVTVTAADDGIKGKDYLAILGGTYTVNAAGDGIKSTNDQDEGRGWLHQYAGALAVAAGDDGIKAENELTLSGGTATVTESTEGIEAAAINLSGATVNVTAADDGINASADSSREVLLNISAGSVTVTADGDGLDSNGEITISGGTTVVNGPTGGGNGALDADGGITVTGGLLLATGSDGMAQGLGSGSEQSGVQAALGTTVPAGTPIHVVDSDGSIVVSFVPTRDTANVLYSAGEITDGQGYGFWVGGSADVESGLGTGSLDGATEQATATAGQFTSGMGAGMGRGQGGPGSGSAPGN